MRYPFDIRCYGCGSASGSDVRSLTHGICYPVISAVVDESKVWSSAVAEGNTLSAADPNVSDIRLFKFFLAVRIDRMYIYEVRGTCWIILLVFSTAVLYHHRAVNCSKLVRTPSPVPASKWQLWKPDCLHPAILAGYTSVPGRPVVALPCSVRGIGLMFAAVRFVVTVSLPR